MPSNAYLMARGDAEVEWAAVASSSVSRAGYDRTFRRFYVQFVSGATYVYDDVPAEVYLDFLAARSKGKFIYDVIRGANGRRKTATRPGANASDLDANYAVTGPI